jgi:hypothetical protein
MWDSPMKNACYDLCALGSLHDEFDDLMAGMPQIQ